LANSFSSRHPRQAANDFGLGKTAANGNVADSADARAGDHGPGVSLRSTPGYRLGAYIGITKQLALRIRFPGLSLQKKIAAELDLLGPETQRLASLYQRKLAALDELKQSLLSKAFAGELTA
jgi:hypothetical protein